MHHPNEPGPTSHGASMLVALASFVCLSVAHGDEPKPIGDRVAGRDYPSVFQAWNPADNLGDEPRLTTLARHDLVFHAPSFYGLKWEGRFDGLSSRFTPASLEAGRKMRAELLGRNPNLVLLAEVRYRDAHASYLPKDHPWWLRKEGRIAPGWEEGGYLLLDFDNPDFRAQVARQARAVVDSGVCDGIMLDWWTDDDAHLALVREIRGAIGDTALVLANANDRPIPRTAEYLNGTFMECYRSETTDDWRRIADTLQWAEANLRPPRINCLETWHKGSRNDLRLVRATTALTLTLSDGYCLHADPNPLPTPDHLHDWYPFWDERLGQPLAKGSWQADGSARREFEGGLAVYNPPGNEPVTVEFEAPRTSAATQTTSRVFQVAAGDGDLFLRAAE